jgi:hypothetical protein
MRKLTEAEKTGAQTINVGGSAKRWEKLTEADRRTDSDGL